MQTNSIYLFIYVFMILPAKMDLKNFEISDNEDSKETEDICFLAPSCLYGNQIVG